MKQERGRPERASPAQWAMRAGSFSIPGVAEPVTLALRDEGTIEVRGDALAVVDPVEPGHRVVVPFPSGTHRVVATCVVRADGGEPDLAYVSVVVGDGTAEKSRAAAGGGDAGSDGDPPVVSTEGSVVAVTDAATARAWTDEAAASETYERWCEDVSSDFGGTQHAESADLPEPLEGSAWFVPVAYVRIARGTDVSGATVAVHVDLDYAWGGAALPKLSASAVAALEEDARKEAARKERLSVVLIVVTLLVSVAFVVLSKAMGWN